MRLTLENVLDVEGYYAITDGVLCLSERINLEPFRVATSSQEGLSIDFEKCLTAVE